jgi:N,N'-diacetyllegionaminate synthase
MKTIIIAEAGVNHNGKIDLALKLVDCAAKAKADFVKFQTYSTEDLVQKNLSLAKYQKKNVKKIYSQTQLLKKYELSESDHYKIIKRCKIKKINFLSSPFDIKSINLLKKLKLNTIKIPSGEITNVPYLKKIASLNKKIILSTGMANLDEIKKAIKILTTYGTSKKNIIVLHCSTQYPASIENLNLLSISYLKKELKIETGYSDHSLGLQASFIAVALGAKVIEKHFTLNKKLDGPDHKASLLPNELNKLTKGVRLVERMLGSRKKKPYKEELINLKYVRKYIIARNHIYKGQKFSEKNITTKRSKLGVSAAEWDKVIGKKSRFNFMPDENVKI